MTSSTSGPSAFVLDLVLRRMPRRTLLSIVHGLSLAADENSLSSIVAAIRGCRATDTALLEFLSDRELQVLAMAVGVPAAKRSAMLEGVLAKSSASTGAASLPATPRQPIAEISPTPAPPPLFARRASVPSTPAAAGRLRVAQPIAPWPSPSPAPAPASARITARTRKKPDDALAQATRALKLTPHERLPGTDDETFVALDFETADSGRDSACAIALVRVEQGQIVQKLVRLIRPPRASFPNAWVHGIQWEHVRGEPTFAEQWPAIRGILEGAHYVVAHNAPFDRSVMRACCTAAGIPELPVSYECSMRLTRRTWTSLPSAKLNVICAHLGIPLKHHDAGSDAEACAMVVLAARARLKLPPR